MTTPHDPPEPTELLAAVRQLLAEDVVGALSGALAFQVRVANHVLAIVERQIGHEEAHDAAHAERLQSLRCSDETELAQRIRRGDFDGHPELLAALIAAVADKLSVTNPKYAESPTQE